MVKERDPFLEGESYEKMYSFEVFWNENKFRFFKTFFCKGPPVQYDDLNTEGAPIQSDGDDGVVPAAEDGSVTMFRRGHHAVCAGNNATLVRIRTKKGRSQDTSAPKVPPREKKASIYIIKFRWP